MPDCSTFDVVFCNLFKRWERNVSTSKTSKFHQLLSCYFNTQKKSVLMAVNNIYSRKHWAWRVVKAFSLQRLSDYPGYMQITFLNLNTQIYQLIWYADTFLLQHALDYTKVVCNRETTGHLIVQNQGWIWILKHVHQDITTYQSP